MVEHDLLEGRATHASTAGGVGGTVATLTGTLRSFHMAGHDFGPFQAEFMTSAVGAFDDPYVMGNIGGGVLKPFRMVLDYPNRRIALIKR